MEELNNKVRTLTITKTDDAPFINNPDLTWDTYKANVDETLKEYESAYEFNKKRLENWLVNILTDLTLSTRHFKDRYSALVEEKRSLDYRKKRYTSSVSTCTKQEQDLKQQLTIALDKINDQLKEHTTKMEELYKQFHAISLCHDDLRQLQKELGFAEEPKLIARPFSSIRSL
jgi:chromosome segregation ATPase